MRRVLLAALMAVASLPAPSAAQPAPPDARAEAVLASMLDASTASYTAVQYVAYLGDPHAAARVDVVSSPDGRRVRTEAGTRVTERWHPATVSIDPDDVMAKYDVVAGDTEDLLGVRVVPIDLERRIDRRDIERLWVDPDTGVVMRREVYGDQGEIVAIAAVIDMRWGEVEQVALPLTPVGPAARETSPPDAPDNLAYGYRFIEAYDFDVDGRDAQQWVYTDGIHRLSVFTVPGAMRATGELEAEGRVFAGPGPGTWVWEGDGHTWAIVAEEPSLDVGLVAAPFPSGGRSFWARLGSVWARGWRLIS